MEQKKLKSFEVKGAFLEKKNKKRFTKTVVAVNENTARQKLLCDFGSKHKLKRRHIFIEEIKEVR